MRKLLVLDFFAKKLKTLDGSVMVNLNEFKCWKYVVCIVTFFEIVIVNDLKNIRICENCFFNSVIFIVIGLVSEYILLNIIANIIYCRLKKSKDFQNLS